MSANDRATVTEVITIYSSDDDFEPPPKRKNDIGSVLPIKMEPGAPVKISSVISIANPLSLNAKLKKTGSESHLVNGAQSSNSASPRSSIDKSIFLPSKSIVVDVESSKLPKTINGSSLSKGCSTSKLIEGKYDNPNKLLIVKKVQETKSPGNNHKLENEQLKLDEVISNKKNDSINLSKKIQTNSNPTLIGGIVHKGKISKEENIVASKVGVNISSRGKVEDIIIDDNVALPNHSLGAGNKECSESAAINNSVSNDGCFANGPDMPATKILSVDSALSLEKSSTAQKLPEDKQLNNELERGVSFTQFMEFIRPKMNGSDYENEKIMKNLKSSFNSCEPLYIQSISFQKLIKNTMDLIKINPVHFYFYLIEFVKELKFHKVSKRKQRAVESSDSLPPVAVGVLISQPSTSGAVAIPSSNTSVVDATEKKTVHDNGQEKNASSCSDYVAAPVVMDSMPSTSVASDPPVDEFEKKKRKEIKRLERYFEQLNKKIRKVQRKSLSLDDMDEEDSTYILECRLKSRCVKVWNELCRLKNCTNKVNRELHKNIHYSGTKYSDLNKRIEHMINKRKMFPDYTDIYTLAKNHFEDIGLKMGSCELERFAKELFTEVGGEISLRRKRDDELMLHEYIPDFIDDGIPKEEDEECLKQRFEESARLFTTKFNQILTEYTAKQETYKEEPGDDSEGDLSDAVTCEKIPGSPGPNQSASPRDNSADEHQEVESITISD